MLDARYGRTGGRQRWLWLVVVPVVVAFLAWVVWAAWLHATPEVDSELTRWQVVDDHTVTASVHVRLDEGADARCLVRALAEDHTPVGDLSWEPTDGANEVSIRTEREATAVELVGCTTPDQKQAR